MKGCRLLSVILLGATFAGDAIADDKQEAAIAGSYLVTQDDKFQRVLTLEPGGAIFQVSDQQTLLGFSAGQGSWKQTGPAEVRARVIDFSYDLKTGKRVGPGFVDYDLKFSDEKAGKFQSVSGSLSGSVFPEGDNPLNPAKQPLYSFSVGLKGDRIGVE